VLPKKLHYFSGYPALKEKGVQGLLDLLKKVVIDHKATFLVIDGVDNVEAMASSLVAYRELIHSLQTFVSLAKCTTFLLTPSLPGLSQTGPELAVSDGVIELGKQQFGPRTIREIQIHKFRGGSILEGRHQIEITSKGVVIHPRTEVQFADPVESERHENRARMAFGIKRLDEMLRGGFLSGSMSTLYGAPGTGKTSLGLSFLAEGARRGEHGIYLGFYETPGRLLEKSRSLGLPVEEFVKKGLIELQWQQSVENIPDAIAERLLERIRAKGKTRVRVFIDGMSGFRRAMPYSDRFGPFLAALTNELRNIGATSLYSEEEELFKTGVAVPHSELGSIVDNLLYLRYVEVKSQLYRLISIMKARESDYDSSIREYAITSKGIVVSDSLMGVNAGLSGEANVIVPGISRTASAARKDRPKKKKRA
jgi:circadian clock protein KaiC